MRCLVSGFAIAAFASGACLADVSQGLSSLQGGDVAAASAQFAAAFEAGDPAGAFWLGRMFELGIGTAPDAMRAANLYAAAAQGGDAASQLRLGLMYHEGTVLLRDYAEGTGLICAAADSGLAEAKVACGLAFEAGRGTEADSQRAADLWREAAEEGNVAAMNLMGASALRAEDIEAASRWFTASAEAGNAVGMVETARILAGQDAPDLVGAYVWSSLAVVRGHPEAGPLRDDLERRLGAAEIGEAQARARAWTEAQMRSGG